VRGQRWTDLKRVPRVAVVVRARKYTGRGKFAPDGALRVAAAHPMARSRSINKLTEY
jgi:hypothetical protein